MTDTPFTNLRDLIAETAADLSNEEPFWTAGCLADALIKKGITHTQQSDTPVAWMPIESAPHDEEILAAIKVRHADGQKRWERHIIVIDSETGMIRDADFHHGWEAEEYECWQPMPAAPDHIVEPTAMVPATDVAALVEAAKMMAEDYMTSEHHHPEYVLVSTVAFEQIRQALAPFTKGQP